MKREAEKQPGNLRWIRPPIFGPGELCEIVGDYGMLMCAGGIIVTPPEGLTFPAANEQTAGGIDGVVSLVTVEAVVRWENLEVSLADVLKDA